jgi:hypothetical protein
MIQVRTGEVYAAMHNVDCRCLTPILLLSQLGAKADMAFVDSSHQFDPKSIVGYEGLVVYGFGQPSIYIPKLHMDSKEWTTCSFERWWEATVILARPAGGEEARFTRRDLVLNLADTDGGAHVDPALDKKYHALSRGGLAGWKHLREGIMVDLRPGPELASMRQIAHEMMVTLERAYPELEARGRKTIPPTGTPSMLVGNFQIRVGPDAVLPPTGKDIPKGR